MIEQFQPERLKVDHVVDQKGPIHDELKARVMAEEESKHREFGRMYEAYLSAPEGFLAAHPTIDRALISRFDQLRSIALPAEYVTRYSGLRAEIAGELYDFRTRIRTYSEDGLAELRHSLSLAVDAGFLLHATRAKPRTDEYARLPEDMNHWLAVSADSMKLQAVEQEFDRRSETTKMP